MIELLLYAGAKAVARGASVAGKTIATRQAKAQVEAEVETSDWAAKALARFGKVPADAAPPATPSMPSRLVKAQRARRSTMRPSVVIKSGPSRTPGFVGTNMKVVRAPAKLAARTSTDVAAPAAAVPATMQPAANPRAPAPAPAKSRLLATNPAAYRVPVSPSAPKPSLRKAAPAIMPANQPAASPASPPPAAAAPAFLPRTAPAMRTPSPSAPTTAASTTSAATPTAVPVRQPLARPTRNGTSPPARTTFGKRPG